MRPFDSSSLSYSILPTVRRFCNDLRKEEGIQMHLIAPGCYKFVRNETTDFEVKLNTISRFDSGCRIRWSCGIGGNSLRVIKDSGEVEQVRHKGKEIGSCVVLARCLNRSQIRISSNGEEIPVNETEGPFSRGKTCIIVGFTERGYIVSDESQLAECLDVDIASGGTEVRDAFSDVMFMHEVTRDERDRKGHLNAIEIE